MIDKARRSRYFALILFSAAFMLRLPGINRVPVMDEPKAVMAVNGTFRNIMTILMGDSQPPLYFYALKIWSYISADPWFLRLFSVLLGALTCLFLYKIVKLVYNEAIAEYAFLIAAISPQLIFNSQYLRPYAFAAFLTALLVYLFIKFLQDGKGAGSYPALFTILTAAALYSFYASILVIAAFNICAICVLRDNPRKLFTWLGSQAVALVLFSFWLPYFFTQKYLVENNITCHIGAITDARLGLYIGKVHVGNLVRILLGYLNIDDISGGARRYSGLIRHGLLFASAVLFSVIFASALIAKAAAAMFKQEKIRRASLVILGLIFIPPAFFAVLSIAGDLKLCGPTLVNMRYLTQSSVFFIIAAAVIFSMIRAKMLRRAVFSCLIIFFLFLDMNIYQYPGNIYGPAIDYLSDRARPCEFVVISPPNALDFFNVFSDRKLSGYKIMVFDDKKKDAGLEGALKKTDRFYFYYFRSAENLALSPDAEAKFDKLMKAMGFSEEGHRSIGDVIYITYFKKAGNR